MKRIFKAAVAALMLAVGFAGSGAAGPFEDATVAAEKGDFATAAPLMRLLADKNHAQAQSLLGSMYYDGRGVPQDYAAALGWFRKAAVQGNAMAQNNLGFMYDKGQGVPQDYAAAVSWYRKATEQGRPWLNSISGPCTMTATASRRTMRPRWIGIVRRPSRA